MSKRSRPPGKPPSQRRKPMGTDDRIRTATRLMAKTFAVALGLPRAEVQEKVLDAAKSALDESRPDRWKPRTIDVEGKSETCVNPVAMFRLALDGDRHRLGDELFQEHVLMVVRRTLEEAGDYAAI